MNDYGCRSTICNSFIIINAQQPPLLQLKIENKTKEGMDLLIRLYRNYIPVHKICSEDYTLDYKPNES